MKIPTPSEFIFFILQISPKIHWRTFCNFFLCRDAQHTPAQPQKSSKKSVEIPLLSLIILAAEGSGDDKI